MERSRFDTIPHAPKDEFRQLITDFSTDVSPNKVGLVSGMYWNEEGNVLTLPVVEKAKTRLVLDKRSNHDYLPTHGNASFIHHTQILIFGETLAHQLLSGSGSRLASLQTVSGAGANHLGAQFLAKHLQPRRIWIPDITWDNHPVIWQLASDSMTRGVKPLQVRVYPYYDKETHSLKFERMMRLLEQEAETDDILLLHACAQNPTGVDPTKEQWKTLSAFCSLRKLFPFFDLAYQGLASGSLDEDAWAIRHFVDSNLELCVAQTFSKNMSLYGERVGTFHLVAASADAATRGFSQISRIQLTEIYSPPAFGANIATMILSDPELYDQWRQEICMIHGRLVTMRAALVTELEILGAPGDWGYIKSQVGMFTCMNLSARQIALLKTYHIYVTGSGRISIAGLNGGNVRYVAEALTTVMREE
ncbi:uncharacterized protein N7498_009919 [Penicillium cinerascens]|uniref:Aminotransferase class I/classII large domain-containing protein n=1 Tax=Penicillium cinerascens TaxID=70096 RepID=A0A9W9J5I9_9EURO|nr:uncharacterized protein N7498_009919 [Penicillium cinerascens]KAJ5190934.1 hypothetical protein N7498_009919 [Penicillium cinerascens]